MLYLIEAGLYAIPNSYSLKRDCVEKNISDLNLLIFGSSQAYYDFDPVDFSPYSCNLANSNQDLYYDGKILDKYIGRAKNLRTVFITVSYFSLEFKLENTEEAWRKFFYYRFFGIKDQNFTPFDIRDYSLIALYTPQNSLSYILKGFNVNLAEGSTNMGWREVDEGDSSLESDSGKNSAIRQTGYMKEDLLPLNLSILDHMIQELVKRDIRVVLITPPTTRSYYENIDSKKYEVMQKNISDIVKKYSLTYLNYFKSEKFQNFDFVDNSDHLNTSGAIKFANIIKNDLSSIIK